MACSSIQTITDADEVSVWGLVTNRWVLLSGLLACALAGVNVSIQALELTRQLVNLINRTPGTAADLQASPATVSRPGSGNGAAAAAAPQAARAPGGAAPPAAVVPAAAPAGGVAAAAALGAVRGEFGGMAQLNPRFGVGVGIQHPGIAGGVQV